MIFMYLKEYIFKEYILFKQVVGGLYQDHLTLAVAEELERGFGGWVPPAIVV